ncbi:hypothetical protein TSOC_006327 [Tetrabaena socialis]|uniref:Uncharacterized protein n=1 Tax=Tetrabaena socialis TaxID=47790 RepID=A0A2J8A3Y3_9CHLO|nr:hypothetical protein TSOC_006327 [Tetrabaena socialis]|eukprot:PNH07224.1 hypothetical protein TSOC_006327 [Tetrabaena socialis]
MMQPEYVIVTCDYEARVHAGHNAQLRAAQNGGERKVVLLRQQHAQELASRDMDLALAKEEGSKLKQEMAAWRKKAILAKLRLASAEDSAQLVQTELSTSKDIIGTLTDAREEVLQCNKALQEQVEFLTGLCRGQHRSKVQQQGELASTSAEAQQLHEQLLQSHALAEHMAQQVEAERAALAAARRQADALQAQLDQEQAALRAQLADSAALRAECSQLRASLEAEQEARCAADAHAGKLGSALSLRGAELQAAEQRLARHVQGSADRDEQRAQEAQRLKAADDAVIEELRHCITQLKERLAAARLESDEELRRQLAKLERETLLREKLEADCEQHRQRLREEQDTHSNALAQHRRQVIDTDAELQLLQDKLAAAERKASARAAQILELEASMERSNQHLGQQVTSKDAVVVALQGQLDQQRRKAHTVPPVPCLKQLEHKEAEVRDAQETHTRQLEQLQRRLAEQEAYAREQEAGLRQKVESARLQATHAGSTEAQTQQRLAELQAALSSRDEQLRQLQGARAAEAAQRDERGRELQGTLFSRDEQLHQLQVARAAEAAQLEERARGLQAAHAAEVARLEARVRQLEQQVAVAPSPAEPPRNQVRAAAAVVDRLMDHLLAGDGLAGGGMGAIDEDEEEEEERGPSADLIISMSQQHLPQGRAAQGSQQPGGTAPPAPLPVQGARAGEEPACGVAGPSGAAAAAAAGVPAAAAKAGHGKRALANNAEGEERPAGKGRGRKAAKGSDGHSAAAPKAAPDPVPAAAEDDEAPAELPQVDAAPAGRQASRRRAAQSGQARAKAMAAALAESSDNETRDAETPGFELKGPKAPRHAPRAAAKQSQRAKAGEAAVAADDAEAAEPLPTLPSPGEAAAAPAKGRGRQARGTKGGQSEDPKPSDPDAGPSGSGRAGAAPADGPALPPAARGGEAQKLQALAMPPPWNVAERPGAGAAAAAEGVWGVGSATQDVDLHASQQPTQQAGGSQPATQPQPAQQPAASRIVAATAGPAAAGPDASRALPASSQISIFSQSLRAYEPQLAKNPLGALNPK